MTSFNLPLPLCFLCLPGEKLEGKKTIICIANEKHQKVSENVSLPKISIHLVDFFLFLAWFLNQRSILVLLTTGSVAALDCELE